MKLTIKINNTITDYTILNLKKNNKENIHNQILNAEI